MKAKKTLKKTNPRMSFLSFAELSLILLFTMVKSYRFYIYIGLADYALPTAFLTTEALLGLYTLLLFVTRRNPSTVVFVFYAVMCLLMFADRLYFSYFSTLPGVAKLNLLKYLTGVTDSVGAILNISHFLYLVDLPVFILYFIFARKRIAKFFTYTGQYTFRYYKCALCILTAGMVLFTSVLFSAHGGYYAAIKSEIFFYHSTDLLSAMLPTPVDDVDVTKYLSHDADAKYAGIAQGKNLINIQVEALNAFPIGRYYEGQEITPNLNRLLEADTLYFDNYYWCVIGGGGTSDAEFAVNNSLYAPSNAPAYDQYTDNDYYGLPFVLKDNGYKGAYAFHGFSETFWNRYQAYPFQGFDDFISGEDLENTDTVGLGISDEQFFLQSIDYLSGYKQPFYAFLITLSSHHPFEIPAEYQELTLAPEHEGSMFADYLQSIHYVDKCIGIFLDALKETGLYDNSVITIYGDHYGLNRTNDDGFTDALIGRTYNQEEIFKIPLIVHIPGSGITETVSTTGSHMDYEPTILSLLGIQNKKAVMFGQNLLEYGISGRVYGQNQMSIGGFITDDYYAEQTALGLTVFDKKTWESLDPAAFQELTKTASKTLSDAHTLLERNQIRLSKIG